VPRVGGTPGRRDELYIASVFGPSNLHRLNGYRPLFLTAGAPFSLALRPFDYPSARRPKKDERDVRAQDPPARLAIMRAVRAWRYVRPILPKVEINYQSSRRD